MKSYFRSLPALSTALFLTLFVLAPAHAKRLALVIGNDNYQFTEKLINARNDADAIAKALQAAGFAVTRHHDLSRQGPFRAVDSFVQRVAKDDEVVVFFSGHGVQIDAAPYLLPTDIKADSARQVTRDALALDSLVGDLSKARFTLVVVDACRNNPFAVRGQRSLGADKGLQPIEPPEGTAIIFSAGRGQAALDTLGQNDTERQGVFTREFLKHMTAPGLQVRDLLLTVRDSVEQKAASVSHKQRPALIDETRGSFYFYPPRGGVVASPGKPPPASDALAVAAMAGLGFLYENAWGSLAKDPVQAVAWYRKGVEAGDGQAMNNLGAMHANGRAGLTRDTAQARQWYERAAALGNELAKSNLAKLP